MNELAKFCKELKKDFKPKINDPKKPVAFWSEKDVLDKKIVDAFVIIFRTRGCSWAFKSGCTMCGYFNDSLWEKVTDQDILTQFENVMKKYNGQKFVKIFTSGSFFDDKEISSDSRKKIIGELVKTTDKISVESRPEYISQKNLSEIKKIIGKKIFEIGIGLETADDTVREKNINKGFTYNDFKKAADLIKKNGFELKTYVIIKPPMLSEKRSIDDAINTVKKIKNLTHTISFNPINIQRNTYVNYLWQRKKFRPAWLFSIVEILKESKKIAPDVFIKCNIVGGGNIRGAHNCKNCDYKYLKAISDFSLSQNTKEFDNLDCECKETWLDQLEIEDFGFGSLTNMDG